MTENLKTEINEFILNAALTKEPIFDSYKKLCEIEEDQKIDYVEFEWKYYQFYHGNRDLAIERSPENSSSMSFSNLPMDVLEKVVQETALDDRLVLRKVTRSLRNLVDTTEGHCERIDFYFGYDLSSISFENKNLYYEEAADKGSRIFLSPTQKVYKDPRPFHQVMLTDALTILKNPKLKIGELVCDACWKETWIQFLKSLDFQLNVRSFDFNTNNYTILPVLQFMKPKTLEAIAFPAELFEPVNLDEITETEQWKRAQKLRSNRIPWGFRMEKLHHFKEIEIYLCNITDANLIVVIDIFLKSAHLELCRFGFHWLSSEGEMIEKIERNMRLSTAYDAETRRFSIPNSPDHFQMEFEYSDVDRDVLSFTRVSLS